jgi:hypothetical protein
MFVSNRNAFVRVSREDMSSCFTRRHVLENKVCPRVEQEHMSSCSTGRHVFVPNNSISSCSTQTHLLRSKQSLLLLNKTTSPCSRKTFTSAEMVENKTNPLGDTGSHQMPTYINYMYIYIIYYIYIYIFLVGSVPPAPPLAHCGGESCRTPCAKPPD